MKPYPLVVVLLSGCGLTTGEQAQAGDVACEPHGGVITYYVVMGSWFQVSCKNGTRIEGRVKK